LPEEGFFGGSCPLEDILTFDDETELHARRNKETYPTRLCESYACP
jgi:hypothetical protein